MGQDRKPFVVVNPNSANGSTRRHWPAMLAELQAQIGKLEWAFTGAGGDATRITREAIGRGFDLIVAVGGDGTNNEVVNGFFDGETLLNPDCAFSFVCRGTGGDFRKTFGWGLGLDEALDRLVTGRTRPIDLGRMTYTDEQGQTRMRHFINITSFGIGGLVDKLVNSSSKALGGKASFMIASLRAMLRYRNQVVRLSVDGKPEIRCPVNTVAVANGRFFGGGMMIAPNAEPDDGLFDVVILGDLGTAEMVRLSRHLYAGTHLNLEKVQCLRGRRIEAQNDNPQEAVLIDMDGEQPGRLPASFEILPSVLPLCVE